MGKEYLLNYSQFFRDQNDYREAIRISERLKYYCSEQEAEVADETIARINITLGNLYYQTQRMKEARLPIYRK